MTAPDHFDQLMHRGWPAPTCVVVDGWLARLADGVTRRANSVLPVAAPEATGHAIDAVERLYAGYGLATRFQLTPSAAPAGLDRVLADRGYAREAPTLVLVADLTDVVAGPVRDAVTTGLTRDDVAGPSGAERTAADTDRVVVADAPDERWMDLWWSVDGRGDATARAVARRILTGGSARYATVADRAGPVAVGRVALVGAWAGIYCMAVREDARGRGLGGAVLRALAAAAGDAGASRLWLQVLTDNRPARRLYRRVGFTPASSHHYRVRRRT